jgi:hypothetical protein
MARSIASSDDGQTSRRLLKKVEMPTSNASFVSIGSDYAQADRNQTHAHFFNGIDPLTDLVKSVAFRADLAVIG